MRVLSIPTLVLAVLAVGVSTTYEVSTSAPAQAQLLPGEFSLRQPGVEGPVGWVFTSADKKHEYWAYIEGVYDWADQSNGGGNPWQLDAEYVGAPCYPNFRAFRDAILVRSAAQGHVITFQDHSIDELTVSN